MKVLVFGGGRHAGQLIAALLAAEALRKTPVVVVVDEPAKLTGSRGYVVLLDELTDITHVQFPHFPEPDTCDRRRRSKGDKHRNRKHRWGAS
ncbi:hypothetical protein [Dyella sp. ASV21]|uniref:hypothetical protein n=1 Tax=Dyella sp. ASV21 TaxID=2795114 RepID=UPI0018EB9046|nr:hypothetical protein [Dyella sp. ASV21]